MDNQQPSINNGFFYQRPKEGCGYIYKYTSPSNEAYIGQTINSLKDRAKDLLTGRGYKKCTIFWKAIQKYGWKNFSVCILEEVEVDKLNEREIYYIKHFNTLVPNGYNLTPGGESGKCQEVYVYSAQNGQFIEHYNSITEASNETGVSIETISTIINNSSNRRQSHNLTFTTAYIPVYDITQLSRNNYHRVYVYDKDGNYLKQFETIADAASELKIGYSSIAKCFNGKALHASYYQFRDEYFDKIKPIPKNSKTPVSVCQIDPETQEVINTFPSYAAAGRAVGLTSGDGIKKVIKRGKGLSGGYFWKLNEGSTTKCSGNPTETVRDSAYADEDIV